MGNIAIMGMPEETCKWKLGYIPDFTIDGYQSVLAVITECGESFYTRHNETVCGYCGKKIDQRYKLVARYRFLGLDIEIMKVEEQYWCFVEDEKLIFPQDNFRKAKEFVEKTIQMHLGA